MADASSRNEAVSPAVARAWADPEYKQRLLTNPHEAILQETDARLPEVYQVTVLEETPPHGYLVIPINTAELSEDQLDMIAGGHSMSCNIC